MFFQSKQKLRHLDDIPLASAGAPEPYLLADEHGLTALYYVAESATSGGEFLSAGVAPPDNNLVAVIRFERAKAHSFGPPNDEAIEGHPLYKLGLKPYAVAEVECSHWIATLRDRNRVHPRHRDARFASCRHFIFTFHDSTLEVIADGLAAEVVQARTVFAAVEEEVSRRARR